MKKAILATTLSLICVTSVRAQVQLVEISVDQQMKYYADLSVVQKPFPVDKPMLRNAWVKVVDETARGDYAWTLRQYNCDNLGMAYLSFKEYSAGGKLIRESKENPNGWDFFPPGSIGDSIARKVCGK